VILLLLIVVALVSSAGPSLLTVFLLLLLEAGVTKKKKKARCNVDAKIKRICKEKVRIYKRTKTNPKTKMCDLDKDLQKKIRIFLQNMASEKKIPALIICRENALKL
jgi:hypothetical protein